MKALGAKRRRSMVVALPLLLLCGGACFAHAQEGCDTADTTRLCAAACDPAAEGATPVCRNQVCVDEYWNNQQVAFGTNQVCVEEKLVDCSRNCGFQGTNVVANYAVPDNALDNQWAATPAGHACRAGQALLQGSACELECEPSYTAIGNMPGCSANCAALAGTAACVENECTAFSTTYSSAHSSRIGYTVPSPDETLRSALGDLVCDAGFNGVATTVCPEEGGTFTELSGCSENECAAIAFAAGVTTDPAGVRGCVADERLTVASDPQCTVSCEPGYRSPGSSVGTFQCAADAYHGQAATGGITCNENECAPITIDTVFSTGVEGTASNGCQLGDRLTTHTRAACTVQCESGYRRSSGSGPEEIRCGASSAHDAAATGALTCEENECAAITLDLVTLLQESSFDIIAAGVMPGEVDGCSDAQVLSTRTDTSCSVVCNTTTHVFQEGEIVCSSSAEQGQVPSLFSCTAKRCTNAHADDYAAWNIVFSDTCDGKVAGQNCPYACIDGYEGGSIMCGFDGVTADDGNLVVTPCTPIGCTSLHWDGSVSGQGPTHVASCSPDGCPSTCPTGCVTDEPLDSSTHPFVCEQGYTASSAAYRCLGGIAATLSEEPCRPTVCVGMNWTGWETFNLRLDPSRSAGIDGVTFAHDVSVGTNGAHVFMEQYLDFACAIGYEINPSVLLVCDDDGLTARFSAVTGPCSPLVCTSLNWQTGVTAWTSTTQSHSSTMPATNVVAEESCVDEVVDCVAGGYIAGDSATCPVDCTLTAAVGEIDFYYSGNSQLTATDGAFISGTAITSELLDTSFQERFACAMGYSVQTGVILNCETAGGAAVFSGQPCDFTGCTWSSSEPVRAAAHVKVSGVIETELVSLPQLGDLECESGYEATGPEEPSALCHEAGGAFEFAGCDEIRCQPLLLAQLPSGAVPSREERTGNNTNCVDDYILTRHTNKSCHVACAAGYQMSGADVVVCESDTQGLNPTTTIECSACRKGFYSPGTWRSCIKCHGLEWDHDSDPTTPCVPHNLCPKGQEIVPGVRSAISIDEEDYDTFRGVRPGFAADNDCQPCEIGKYRMDADRYGCVDCGTGMVCPYVGMSRPLPAAAYFVSSTVLVAFSQQSAEDRVPAMCVPPEACLGSRIGDVQATGPDAWARESCIDQGIPFSYGERIVESADACTGPCAVGYERDRCSMCTQGYKRVVDGCEQCPEQPIGTEGLIAIAICAIIFFSLIVAVLIRKLAEYSSSMAEVATPALILVTFAQTLSSMLGLQMAWPPFVRRLFKMLAVFNVSLAFADPECSFEFNFQRKQWLALSLPVFTMLVGHFFIHGQEAAIAVRVYKQSKESTDQTQSKDWKAKHLALLGSNEAVTTVRTMWATAFNLLSIFFTTTMVQSFDCMPVREGDEKTYLVVEPIVECTRQKVVKRCTGATTPVASRFARCTDNTTAQAALELVPQQIDVEELMYENRSNSTNSTNGTTAVDRASSLPATIDCGAFFRSSMFTNASGCPATQCLFEPIGTNSTPADCGLVYAESSECPAGCQLDETTEFTDWSIIESTAIAGSLLYVGFAALFIQGLLDNRKGFDSLLDQMKPGFSHFQLWMMLKKLCVTFVAQFAGSDVARGWFLTNMVVSTALILQIWWSPYASAAANACEALSLVATLVVVTCGATFQSTAATDEIADMAEGDFEADAVADITAINAAVDMEDYNEDLQKAANDPYFNLLYDVKDGFVRTKFLGQDWFLVRRNAAAGGCWHQATDHLTGTAEYGVNDEGKYACTNRESLATIPIPCHPHAPSHLTVLASCSQRSAVRTSFRQWASHSRFSQSFSLTILTRSC